MEYIYENTSGKQALKGLTLTQSDNTVNKLSIRDGLVVEVSMAYPDSKYYKIVYSYNEQCDPICETHYANDSPEPINTSHYEYVYDNVGNWVKKRLILDNKEETEDSPTFIYKLTRSIGYFD